MIVNRNRNFSGFTLIEVVIGMTLLSLLMLFMFSGLRTTALSWEASDRISSHNDEARLLTSFIRRQFKQLVPIIVREKREFEVVFEGNHDSVRLVSRLPVYRGTAGLYVVSFKVNQDSRGNRSLIYTYQPLHTDTVLFEEDDLTREQILIEDIQGIEFNYYGKDEIDDEVKTWSNQWSPVDRLPDVISMKIYRHDSEYDWPEIIVNIPTQVALGQAQLTLLNPLHESGG